MLDIALIAALYVTVLVAFARLGGWSAAGSSVRSWGRASSSVC